MSRPRSWCSSVTTTSRSRTAACRITSVGQSRSGTVCCRRRRKSGEEPGAGCADRAGRDPNRPRNKKRSRCATWRAGRTYRKPYDKLVLCFGGRNVLRRSDQPATYAGSCRAGRGESLPPGFAVVARPTPAGRPTKAVNMSVCRRSAGTPLPLFDGDPAGQSGLQVLVEVLEAWAVRCWRTAMVARSARPTPGLTR